MAAAATNSGRDGKKSARNTPGRKGRTGNQYFEPGKVGRKTGITLVDTGVRDEHGLEPMSGIFSSPASPPKRAEDTSSSHAMELESSAPDVNETLQMRKTPRLPPPRATTPRHTNIGSPKRMSSARPQSRNVDANMASEASPDRASTQPPPNRVLNFGAKNVRMSIEHGSPFKPKRVLRRSPKGATRNEQQPDFPTSSPGRHGKPELPTMENEVAEEDDDSEEVEDIDMETEAGAGAEAESEEPPSKEQQQLNDQLEDDAPPMFYGDDDYDAQAEDPEITEAMDVVNQMLQTTPAAAPSTKKPRGRPRKSGASVDNSQLGNTPQTAQTSSSKRKLDQTELQDDEADQTNESIEQTENDISQISTTSGGAAKKRRGRPRKSEITVLQDPTTIEDDQADETIQSIEQGGNDESQMTTTSKQSAKKPRGRPRKSDVTVVHDETEQAIDPALLAHGDSYLAPVEEEEDQEIEGEGNEEQEQEPTIVPASPVANKGSKKAKAQNKRVPKERDPNKSMRRPKSPSPGKNKQNEEVLTRTPSKRAGSVSNVNLRASTPFEDAHQRMSRSGRPILKPLKHWAGESYVWKNGEVEGIIRADEVKTPKGDKKKKQKAAKGRRRAPRAGGRAASNDLDSIAEESDTESTVPDDWEEQVGVIAGTVAAWDPDSQQGNPAAPIREDIAFASSSILTRDVAGSAFQYAKIMTLPFFGSGIVELPPEGFKRAKNSRKMQMVFFVHEGKVLVTVGPPAVEQNGDSGNGHDAETNEFAISKGGVWVVPRGNNYSISNESRTKSARIFFAQGCEVEPEMASQQ